MSDLCKHYEYNEFLMGELMEIMPYGELIDLLGKFMTNSNCRISSVKKMQINNSCYGDTAP